MKNRLFPITLVATCITISILARNSRGEMTLAAGASTQPAAVVTDSASTKPASYSIHGRVNADPGLDLQKIDLSRAVVYLESDPVLDAFPLSDVRPQVAQRNKAFIPKFLAIAKGTYVEFPNWDHIAHNVFSRSAAAPAFDLDRYPYGQSKTRQFDKVGIVQVFCNIHPYMRAMIFVAPNSFFARADKDGDFRIDGLPAGHYQLSAWQERCQTQHQSVDVGPGLDPAISFTLSEDRQSIISNDSPRHGNNYGVERGLNVKHETLNLPVVRESHPAPTTAPCDLCN